MSSPSVNDTAVRPPATEAGVFDHVVLGGYMLEHRIGTGGYGEVWKAIGPGGFAKAVKVLFGNLDGARAETELRSLQRMRDLRHPFLLNIERVDIQNGQVFVVTELADGSLDNRFEKYRSAGHAGIPRDELLGYLRDAADALDYMANDQGLQHLDVKPENLLLQGNHVKVGDFGLTRDISRSGVTAMGGFTPLYTPPEVFEGKPGRTSDQYSLAIVYQLMLTGTAPFSGRTPAQLAAQHLRSRPDLTPLEPAERPIVARALSKTATARFPTCREFIEALVERKVTGRDSDRSWSAYSQPVGEVGRTRVVDPDAGTSSDEQCLLPSVPVTVSPPTESTGGRPTIFIGLGGLGGSVFCSVYQGLRDAPGFDRLSFLYVDSDRTSITAARYQDELDLLKADQTLLLPLKSAAEYRRSSHLKWLSRRWLFNMPKSGQVEGIRPLGRLALLDHYQLLREKLTHLLTASSLSGESGPDSIPGEVGQASLAPEIVVVAGTNGGFGSGAVLDVAYLIRDVLAAENIHGVRVTGCLLHGTGLSPQSQQLQEANTYACLTEMKYYGTQGLGYDCSISASDAVRDITAFDDCCFVHLGDELSSHAFSTATADVADYLRASVAGEESRWLRDWRRSAALLQDGQPQTASSQTIRTIGFARIDDDTMQFAAQMCHAVAAEWSDDDYDGRRELTAASTARINDAMKRMTPSASLLREHVEKIATGKLQELKRNFVDTLKLNDGAGLHTLAECLERLNAEDNRSGPLGQAYQNLAHGLVRQIAAKSEGTVQLLQSVCVTRAGMEAVGGYVLRRLQSFQSDCFAFHADTQSQTQDLISLKPAAKPDAQSLMKLCRLWSLNVMTQTLATDAERLSAHTAKLILNVSEQRSAEIQALRRHFADVAEIENDQLAEDEAEIDAVLDADNDVDEPAVTSAEQTDEPGQIPETLVKLLSDQLLNSPDRTVGDCISAGGAELAASMMIQRAVEMATSVLTSDQDSNNSQPLRFPANAQPYLKDVGGRHRVLAVTPGSLPEKWKASLSQSFGDCVAECPGASRLTFWCEVEGIPLDNVQQFLRRSNSQVADVASRVQTRRDIEWNGLWA